MTVMTKQSTIAYSCVENSGLSLNDYVTPEFYYIVGDKLLDMQLLNQTDNIQYNVLVSNWESSGIYLDKYPYYTSIRLWTTAEDAEEFKNFLILQLQSLGLEYDHTFVISDIDPELNYIPN